MICCFRTFFCKLRQIFKLLTNKPRCFKVLCTSCNIKNNEIFAQFMFVLTLNPNLLPHAVHFKSSTTYINKQKHTCHRVCIIQATWSRQEKRWREKKTSSSVSDSPPSELSEATVLAASHSDEACCYIHYVNAKTTLKQPSWDYASHSTVWRTLELWPIKQGRTEQVFSDFALLRHSAVILLCKVE